MNITMCANSARCPLEKFCVRSALKKTVSNNRWQNWENFHVGTREGCEYFIPNKEYKDGIKNKNRR